MGYENYSEHFVYKQLLTYQELNQLGSNDEYFKSGASVSVGGAWTFGQGISCPTINTGYGDVECYGMNQDVKTTSDVTFASVSLGSQTRYYTIDLSDFLRYLGDMKISGAGNVSAYSWSLNSTTSEGRIFAPLHLPHNAELSEAKFWWENMGTSTASWGTACIEKYSMANEFVTQIGLEVLCGTSEGTSCGTISLADHLISNDTYKYVAYVNISENQPVSNHVRFLGGCITYKITDLAP